MFDSIINSLSGLRVAGQPVGEGIILTMNMVLSQVGMTLGQKVMGKMNVPELPAKLLGNGVAIIGLPMLMKMAKLGNANTIDRLTATAIGMTINDVVGTEQIISNMLAAIPFLSGTESEAVNDVYVEFPYEQQILPDSIVPRVPVTNYQEVESLSGMQDEDYIQDLLALQK